VWRRGDWLEACRPRNSDLIDEEVAMAPNPLKAEGGALVPDPEDWPESKGTERTPEAVANAADDLAASLPDVPEAVPVGADEADVWEQLREGGQDDEDESRPE